MNHLIHRQELKYFFLIQNKNHLLYFKSSDDKQSTYQKKTKNTSLICVICGSSAHGHNFGVISCESCKLFFRRNGLKDPVSRKYFFSCTKDFQIFIRYIQATLICHHNNECEIKVETRRRCLACRLNKCLNSGMKRDRLLKVLI